MNERRPSASALADWLGAAVIAGAAMCLVRWFVPAAAAPFPGHGERFAEIAAAPLSFTGMFPHRILWPLLAHAAGSCGIGPVAFSQLCSWALIAVVVWCCRRRGAAWRDAALIGAAVAASGAVLVYQPMTCLSDSLVLLLFVLAVHFVQRRFVFWALVLLAGLAHEMAFFFVPWLWWLRVREGGGSLRGDGIALAAMLGAYAGWRLLARSLTPADAPSATYDSLYYVVHNFWVPWGLPAMWALWLLVVIVEFGPLLAVIVWAWRRDLLAMGGRAGPWLYVACVLSLMLLAYDVMRFATFAFVPLVLGAQALVRRPRGTRSLAVLVLLAAGAYLWHHPIPSEQGGRQFTDVTGKIRELLLAGRGFATPAEAWSYCVDLLDRTWAIAVATTGSVALVAMLALLLGRYVGAASDDGGEPRTIENASP